NGLKDADAFHDQEGAVEQSPHDEVPARPVPQSAQREHDEEVRVASTRGDPVPPERDVKVVPKPGRQRDVPAPPEVGHARGKIWIVEVHVVSEDEMAAVLYDV